MKTQRLAIALTMMNLVLLVFLLAQIRPATAQGVAPVLRGNALEIVDDAGRVRASISVHPPEIVNSRQYSEAVVLHLFDPRGGPGIKIDVNKERAALGLADGSETGRVEVHANPRGSFVKVTNADGRTQVVQP